MSTAGMLHASGTVCRAKVKPCPLMEDGEPHFGSQEELIEHLSVIYRIPEEMLEDSLRSKVPIKEIAEMAADGVYFDEDAQAPDETNGDGVYYGSFNGPKNFEQDPNSSFLEHPGLTMSPEERVKAIEELSITGAEVPEMCFVDPDTTADSTKIQPMKNGMIGGLWLSQSYEGGSDWLPVAREYKGRSGGAATYKTIVKPKEDLKILKIDSHEDLVKVISIYPTHERASSFDEGINYEKLKEEGGYGGVWLTRKGWSETNGRRSMSSSNDGKPDYIHSYGKTPALTIFSADGVDSMGQAELVNKDTSDPSLEGSRTLLRLGRKQDAKRFVSFNNYLQRQSLPMLEKQIVKLEDYSSKTTLSDRDSEVLRRLKEARDLRTAAKKK